MMGVKECYRRAFSSDRCYSWYLARGNKRGGVGYNKELLVSCYSHPPCNRKIARKKLKILRITRLVQCGERVVFLPLLSGSNGSGGDDYCFGASDNFRR